MPFSKVNTDIAHWPWTPPSLTTTIGIGIKPRTFCLGVRRLRFTFKSTAYFLVCFVCVFIRYRSSPAPLVSVEEVNQWVEKATNGQIANFMESIPHNVVLMLINAMHFKGSVRSGTHGQSAMLYFCSRFSFSHACFNASFLPVSCRRVADSI